MVTSNRLSLIQYLVSASATQFKGEKKKVLLCGNINIKNTFPKSLTYTHTHTHTYTHTHTHSPPLHTHTNTLSIILSFTNTISNYVIKFLVVKGEGKADLSRCLQCGIRESI